MNTRTRFSLRIRSLGLWLLSRALFGALIVPLSATGRATPEMGSPGQEEEAAEPLPTTIEGLLEVILKSGDAGEIEPIRHLANIKTEAALDALVTVQGQVSSVYMRNAVLRGIALFDDVEGQQQRALQLLMDAATLSGNRTLRLSAVDLIARCQNLGRPFLVLIVNSVADDEVREVALRRHAGSFQVSDTPWYRELWEGRKQGSEPSGKRRRGGRNKDEEEQPAVPQARPLPVLRTIAFATLASALDVEEIYRAAAAERDPVIRARAVQELEARGDERVDKLLHQQLTFNGAGVEDRLYAASVLLRKGGADFAEELIKITLRSGQGEAFVFGVAGFLDELDDAGIDKLILRKLGKGKRLEKRFWMRAALNLEGEKVDKAMAKLLGDKDSDVVRLATTYIAVRNMFAARTDLEKLAEKTDDPNLVADVVDALSVLRRNDPEWAEALVAYAQDSNRAIRNAALRSLGTRGDTRLVEVILLSLDHPDWSTRMAAIKALESMRTPLAVGPMIDRMKVEDGRLAAELSRALFSLTGQPFDTNATRWANWWGDAQAEFTVLTKAQLRKVAKVALEREQREVTRTQFFGVKVESHRVIFILDVSGSMLELTQARYSGERGATRLAVAKEELARVVEALDRASLFNLIVFSGGVSSWRKSITVFDEEALEDARVYVSRLGAGGGTNLFGALELAFQDAEVDTIFVLSDGEPTVGSVTDPGGIRSRVAAWNKNRNVVIHTVAVGGSLKVLEWLAEDSGGKHVRFQ
ncbi:MAG: HEAT repeat protein/Mg-chelatase subunit ChlD [Planctomycetota bacterium]|jgi:HEAT repeat protein/Mg-chelatase subunit ChlD